MPLYGQTVFRLARDEQILTNVLRRDVVTRRQAGLEEELRPVGLGDDLCVHADPDVPGALEDVHPMVRAVGMAVDLLILLVPRVYLILKYTAKLLLKTFSSGDPLHPP